LPDYLSDAPEKGGGEEGGREGCVAASDQEEEACGVGWGAGRIHTGRWELCRHSGREGGREGGCGCLTVRLMPPWEGGREGGLA